MNAEKPISEKLIRNSTFNLIGFVLTTPIQFIIIPYIISRVGIDGYGIWALVISFMGYIGLSDLGISPALTKFIAEYHAHNDQAVVNKLVNTAFVIYVFVGVIISIIFVLLAEWLIILFFKPSPDMIAVIRFIFIGYFLLFIINLVFTAYTSIITGLQRYDISNIINIVVAFISMGGIFLFLGIGLGLKGLIINAFIFTIINIALTLWKSKKIFPPLKFNPFLFDTKLVKTILNYSSKMYISQIATQIYFHIDKLFISYFFNVSYVAYYQIASNLSQKFRAIPALIISPIFPAVSELQAKNDTEKI